MIAGDSNLLQPPARLPSNAPGEYHNGLRSFPRGIPQSRQESKPGGGGAPPEQKLLAVPRTRRTGTTPSRNTALPAPTNRDNSLFLASFRLGCSRPMGVYRPGARSGIGASVLNVAPQTFTDYVSSDQLQSVGEFGSARMVASVRLNRPQTISIP